ncbi:hypothetical protein [uncultured Helicobacter sp.]|uniref:hypothetical protein n=1 Tax=uncultured Helicobacter sp. TaxID=175537 RepID=UPI00374E94C2
MGIEESEVKKEYLHIFFTKYLQFAEIEAVASVAKGRNYEIIKCLYSLFVEISKKKTEAQKVEKEIKELDKQIEIFKEENKDIPSISIRISTQQGYLYTLSPNSDLSRAFQLLVTSMNKYKIWRENLSKEALKEIYKRNLLDKQRFYFKDTPEDLNKELLSQTLVARNYVLRQSLIEFYNGISHLNAAFWNTGDKEDNVKKAKHHFQRGALDSYKAIIKDFSLMLGSQNDELRQKFLKKIADIRQKEYQTIGFEKKRNEDISLYQEYENLVDAILQLQKK